MASGLPKARHFDYWMNLKAMYKTLYGVTPKSLEIALKKVGIKFEGRAHSGIVDARNTAVTISTPDTHRIPHPYSPQLQLLPVCKKAPSERRASGSPTTTSLVPTFPM